MNPKLGHRASPGSENATVCLDPAISGNRHSVREREGRRFKASFARRRHVALFTLRRSIERERLMEGACMLNVSRLPGLRLLGVALLVGLLSPVAARAEDTLGGHFGFVLPLVTRAGGETVSIGDQFKIGFPVGITIKTSEKVAF